MSWLDSANMSTLVGLALTLGLVYLLAGELLRIVLMLGALIFIAVPSPPDHDYGMRALMLVLFSLGFIISVSIYFSWDGGAIAWWLKLYFVALVAVSSWMWWQRDTPYKPWVISISALVVLVWGYVVFRAPGLDFHEYHEHGVQEVSGVEVAPTETLLKWDREFLQALYDSTNGRIGLYVQPWRLQEKLQLSEQEAEVAFDRLVRNGSIEWDDSYGMAIKRKGVETVERHHREKRKRGSVQNTFNFHGNASGVFGSGNRVWGSAFHASGVPVELVEAALSAAVQLRSQLDPEQAYSVQSAEAELRAAGSNETRLRRAARRLAQVAGAAGEVGVPLVRAANEILKALAA